MSLIIGTAGHIDHGKTALIKELNGFEGDRLEEEQKRGITIDLSFSNLSKNGENIAFIDVPGHENLIKTMISGAYGFDACLFVVAANDGLMPQSLEHLEVLNILGVRSLIVALTKCDLASAELIEQRKSEICAAAQNYKNLQILDIFPVSIKDSASIDELRNYLFTLKAANREQEGVFRYYIDRVFSLKGIGNVVTGTVIEGSVSKNEKLFNYDAGKEVQVRSVQSHDKFVERAGVSSRVALNLTGIELNDLKKGQLLSKKGFFRGFREIDAIVFARELTHGQSVTFCVGAKAAPAKALVLSEKEGGIFATFKFERDMFLKFDEPFVLIANGRVIGGGRALNAVSEPMKKSSKISFLNALLKKDFVSAFAMLKDTHKNGFGIISAYQRFGLNHEEAVAIAKQTPNVFVDEKALNIYDLSAVDRIKSAVKFMIEKNEFAVFSATSISLKLSWASESIAQKALDELESAGAIIKNDGVYTKTGVDMSKLKIRLEEKIYEILQSGNLAPLAPYNIYDELEIDRVSGDNALKKLTGIGRVVRLAHNLFVTSKALNEALAKLKAIIAAQGFVNVTNAKEALNLSRKYIIAYLEQLDLDPNIVKNGIDRVLKA
ncbi:selenocysteine-specific translation elongation factor [Campylobacter rectus RM3267]|uniref:Selenocysteine-specific elongation factor n=2 Tax=Campylobacter rectus TaxID=203 RepID=A0A6G5QK26_CAMRE|nr:selenocysteine-specific translation elongation factor [Campylobacter rectus]EEF13135.1 selenocysteine-specific translation elongation factor [Campylobacter rectus RM3267]QCD45979.1 selenocysteine-specific elongation factor [Campylobacter rectus]UEB46699.1 selenocysteine-specific translation elongation factor [Campylobacter rectus]